MLTNIEIVSAVQQRLKELGYYSGKVDGDAGNQTQDAIIAFKRASGLAERSYVGVVTLHALFDDTAIPARQPVLSAPTTGTDTPWMEYARSLIGTNEVAGAASSPTIMQWAKDVGVSKQYANDGVAWCGLFVGKVIHHWDPKEMLPAGLLGSRNWLNFGVPVSPGYGAILVFWRGSKTAWTGHVGFYVGEDANNYYVLGGNQSNTVSITKAAKNRLLGARAPKNLPFTPRKVSMSTSGKVSTNEA